MSDQLAANMIEEIIKSVSAVKGNEPTDAELVRIVRAVATPICQATRALQRIADTLDRMEQRR